MVGPHFIDPTGGLENSPPKGTIPEKRSVKPIPGTWPMCSSFKVVAKGCFLIMIRIICYFKKHALLSLSISPSESYLKPS